MTMAADTLLTPPAPASRSRLAARSFRCCDSDWLLTAPSASAAALAGAEAEAHRLEAILNAFDPSSQVARLNRDGQVGDPIVANVVRRALEVRKETCGAFDITQGRLEHRIKAFIRGTTESVASGVEANQVKVVGDQVTAQAPVDLNGIAKGWMADRVAEFLLARGVEATVNAGGDIAHPMGPVAVDAPGGGIIATLDTRWNVATSGNSKRRRDAIDHLYDPRTGRIGARQQQVTVIAERDCAQADALATVLCVLPPAEATALAQSLDGLEALFVGGGRIWWTGGFDGHLR